MSRADTPNGSVSYLVNGLEQRVSKTGLTVPTGAAYYVYDDEDGNLLGEYDANGTPLYEVIYLRGTPVGVVTPTGLYYVYSDHLGAPRVIARTADHAIVWRWDNTEAFGTTPPNEDPNGFGSFTFNMRFPGQVYDRETGLFYNVNRDYRPGAGRYDQYDPTGLAAGPNPYSYADGNPVSYIDPTGEIAFIPILIGIGAGYAFDYMLEQYKKEHCTCMDTPVGAVGNSVVGGAVGGSGPFASKPRGGIAGGGPSGRTTSSFSQLNHAAASRGLYSVPTRNVITKILRKVPYAGAAVAAYEIHDALSCD
jgi:RHS repeat-associated protein